MTEVIHKDDATTYDKVKALGGDIEGDELVVEYEKTNGGMKTIGGEVVNAHETYNNRENSNKIIIDLESHAGNWRLVAESSIVDEVTLYSYTTTEGKIETTRISTRDGVEDVEFAEEWEADTSGEPCDMCDDDATHDVVTSRSTMRLCPTCLNGQERAGVVEGVHDVGWFSDEQYNSGA
jgi:hypothetical protein